ncbi:MAG: hypothetical protein WA775_00080 [Psychroserpens sp.]|uniref:hypothetical protein n=1 Tax=Psychroserpens sp. TaxID=2020870 RepID=UPI003C73343E
MKPKWYISILIITLTLLGSIAGKQQATAPNQGIVLQFTSSKVTALETQTAISSVTKTLETAGIHEVNIQQLLDGQLKITYYSDADIESIKALLLNENTLELTTVSRHEQSSSKLPRDHHIEYDLDVYEIQQGHELSGVDGKFALVNSSEHDHCCNPNVFIASAVIDFETKKDLDQVAFTFRSTQSTTIDNHSYKIPEVRAGPSVAGNLCFS